MYSQSHALKMVIADSSAIVRTGIKRLLAETPEIQVVEECVDAKCAIAAIGDWKPDFVLTDFSLADGSAVDVLRQCSCMRPRPICVVYTAQADASTRAISYAAGADIFYDKRMDAAPLFTMMRKLSVAILTQAKVAA